MRTISFHSIKSFVHQTRSFWLFGWIISLVGLLFHGMWQQFFSTDDWYHLQLSRLHSWTEWFNFFRFVPTVQRGASYRPLSTQAFFWALSELAGLHAWVYYACSFGLFLVSIWLLRRFLLKLTHSEQLSWIATLVYAVSQTHFTHLYFLSSAQEIFLVLTTLICLLALLAKSSWRADLLVWLGFIGALMSKETAIILPGLIGLVLLFRYTQSKSFFSWSTLWQKVVVARWRMWLGTILIWGGYLYERFQVFGVSTTIEQSYTFDLSPVQTLHTLRWYGLWSLGAPEALIDYMSGVIQVLPRFFTDYPRLGTWSLILTIGVLSGLGLVSGWWLLSQVRAKRTGTGTFSQLVFIVFGGLWFLGTLLPVLFFPQHRFALELGLPMIGFALIIAALLQSRPRWVIVSFLSLYLVLQLVSVQLTQRTHYTVLRSRISEKVHTYFQEKYPAWPANTYFVFLNDTANHGAAWGSSKQISQALMQDNYFKTAYPDQEMYVYYEDFPFTPPEGYDRVELSTQQFLP